MAWTPAGNLKGPKGDPGASVPLPLAVDSGGTGSTTPAAARAALGVVEVTGATAIAVVTALPATPDPNTVYIVKPA